jgi:hypothetical protein
MAGVGQGGHTTGWRSLGLTRVTWWCGPWLLPSLSPFGYFRHLVNYELLDIFLELLIFKNMVS